MSTVNGPFPPRGPKAKDVDQAVKELGYQIAVSLQGTGLGFVLVICDFGDVGTTGYASNAQREGAIEALEGLVTQLKRGDNLIPG